MSWCVPAPNVSILYRCAVRAKIKTKECAVTIIFNIIEILGVRITGTRVLPLEVVLSKKIVVDLLVRIIEIFDSSLRAQ